VAGVVKVIGVSGFVDGKTRLLSRQLLQRMNIAQLQVVVNDLHTQIEGHLHHWLLSLYLLTPLLATDWHGDKQRTPRASDTLALATTGRFH